MYTPSQTASLIGVSVRTLRRYSTDYAKHLSDQAAKRGKHRRYTDEDVLKLRAISSLTRKRKTPEEIANSLENLNKNNGPREGESVSLMVMGEVQKLREQHSSRLDNISEYLHQLAEWERLPWYKKLTTPRPDPPE